MGARKSVDQILDDAASILEKNGYTTSMCYDPETGGYCALGAIARAAFPKTLKSVDIEDLAYANDNPVYGAAVMVAAKAATRRKADNPARAAEEVYEYNDRVKSSKLVVKMLRRAAELARKEAAKS